MVEKLNSEDSSRTPMLLLEVPELGDDWLESAFILE
jgi:hypothetical protein